MGIMAVQSTPTFSTSSMFKMLAYISVPYSHSDSDSKRDAILMMNKFIAGFVRKHPEWYVVNALYNEYGNINIEDAVYAQANLLIQASSLFLVLQVDGWSVNSMVQREAAIAAVAKKPVEYIFMNYTDR